MERKFRVINGGGKISSDTPDCLLSYNGMFFGGTMGRWYQICPYTAENLRQADSDEVRPLREMYLETLKSDKHTENLRRGFLRIVSKQ